MNTYSVTNPFAIRTRQSTAADGSSLFPISADDDIFATQSAGDTETLAPPPAFKTGAFTSAPAAAFATSTYQTVNVNNGGVTFNLEFVASQNPTASFENNIVNAAKLLSAAITDKITVNIVVGYGYYGNTTSTVTGGGAEGGNYFGANVTYAQARDDLLHHAALSDTNFNALPIASAISGETSLSLSTAQEKAFGLLSATSAGDDGMVGFATNISSNLAVGVALHELSHAMGRTPDGIFDFFRFTSAGVNYFGTSTPATASYFSVNGGVTKMADYGVNSDPSDFLNNSLTTNDNFDEYYTGSTVQTLTALDLTQLDALGFNTIKTAPPKLPAVDLNGGANSDVLFVSNSGQLSGWLMSGSTIASSGAIGSPGAAWSEVGVGDFNADGKSDILFRNANGQLMVWYMNGLAIASTATLGNPGVGWSVAGVGNFYGDNETDILMRDNSGQLVDWRVVNGALTSQVALGSPGAGWSVKGIGDFNHDGNSDILFQNATTGVYRTWTMANGAVSGGATLGSPGAGYVFRAIGDFNGDGVSDVLFQNATTGAYAAWTIFNDAAVNGSTLGSPGAGWTLRGVGDYKGDGKADLLFQNASGALTAWDMNGASIVGSTSLGSIGVTNTLAGEAVSVATPLPPTLLFQTTSGGTVDAWNMNGLSLSSSSMFGSPGGDWRALAKADFTGAGALDILFQNAAGYYGIWLTNGAASVSGADIGNPGSAWSYLGVGDFNGDGRSDILFYNASAEEYGLWDMNGTSDVGGGVFAEPGGGRWQEIGIGDFNGDGRSDILFRDSNGELALWEMNDTTTLFGGSIGNPGPAWTYLGVGDFNGDGRSDILFQNSSGTLATWDVSGNSIIGGGTIGSPGAAWAFSAIADLNGDGKSDIVFHSTTGTAIGAWLMNDTTIMAGASVADPGAGWRLVG